MAVAVGSVAGKCPGSGTGSKQARYLSCGSECIGDTGHSWTLPSPKSRTIFRPSSLTTKERWGVGCGVCVGGGERERERERDSRCTGAEGARMPIN